MLRVLAKFPDLTFDAARAEAHKLLSKAAGRFHYAVPPVLSAEQRQAQKARFQTLMDTRQKASDAQFPAIPTPTSTTQPENPGTQPSGVPCV
jgi:hypothetical protein